MRTSYLPSAPIAVRHGNRVLQALLRIGGGLKECLAYCLSFNNNLLEGAMAMDTFLLLKCGPVLESGVQNLIWELRVQAAEQ